MNCRECTDFLMDYLNGELPPAQQRVFEGHLELCQTCLTFLESYRKTQKLGELVSEEAHEPLPDALVRAILAARQVKAD
ncbi:MAG TPA: zf-HC2 domain-containing protein [Myxococcota bacterium]|nr:zf-HC2 domain-containing protein [Myxococcota bacterium]